jgi:CheY-like chemotaxis protein
MEVVGQLAGGVAHDFNNLLTTVMASSELALQDLPDVHPIRQDLEDIRRAAQRGAALTSRLLAFARPRGATARVVDVAERVRSLLPLLRRLLGEGVGVTPDVVPSAGAARLDADELEHALLNLVANARDAMPNGGTVVVRCYERTLDRPLDSSYLPVPAGRYVVVEIADAGTGMGRQTMERIFTPFFTTKETGKGTGLGLAGVLAFVRRSGGGLTVASAPGKGSTFSLWFPRVASHAGDTDDVAPPTPAGEGTILLLEDDEAVRSAARRILASAGYSVIEAASAAEARQRFAECQGHIDLLVADVIMPGESGASLAAALRRQRPGLHVLFVSGYPGADLERLGLREGEVELLRKPYTMQELRERVQEALEREGVLARRG